MEIRRYKVLYYKNVNENGQIIQENNEKYEYYMENWINEQCEKLKARVVGAMVENGNNYFIFEYQKGD